jgi:DNA invertase Pin-like site-specific DNA recombinase
MGWVAEMESKRISERTKAGLARAKAQGAKIGRPKGRKDTRPRQKRQRRPVWE